MTTEMLISQLIFWGIVIFSGMIAYEFYLSRDGLLRILIIQLFLAKCWQFGVAGSYYLAWDLGYFQTFDQVLLRVVCNTPMVIVMWRLWLYIRNRPR